MRSGPPGVQSSHWTIAAHHRQYYIGIVLLTLFHWIVSAYLPPAEDELYYWTWAKDLSASYFDHPPMVAYLIALSTKIFGDNLFGIRFFSSLAAFAVLMLLRELADRAQLLIWACLTPVFFWGSVLMTPDVPLLFFWTCYLFWLVKISKPLADWSGDPVTRVYHPSPIPIPLWAIGGVLLGLGILSKYSMFLAIPCSFLALAMRYRVGGWWKGFLVHLMIAAVVTTPLIYFNVQHDFISFRFQWGNAMQGAGGLSLAKALEYMGGQILMVGALPLIMLPWILLWRPEIRDDSRLDTLFYFFVPTFLFFILQSFRTKLEANWGLVTYLAFWPLAQALMDRSSFKTFGYVLRIASFLVPVAFSALLGLHLLSPSRWIPPEKDRLTRFSEQLKLSKQVTQEYQALAPAPLFLANYQWTAYFRYQGLNAYQAHPSGKDSQYTIQPQDACQYPAIYFFNAEEDPGSAAPALKCFARKVRVKTYDLVVRGQVVGHFYLDRYVKP